MSGGPAAVSSVWWAHGVPAVWRRQGGSALRHVDLAARLEHGGRTLQRRWRVWHQRERAAKVRGVELRLARKGGAQPRLVDGEAMHLDQVAQPGLGHHLGGLFDVSALVVDADHRDAPLQHELLVASERGGRADADVQQPRVGLQALKDGLVPVRRHPHNQEVVDVGRGIRHHEPQRGAHGPQRDDREAEPHGLPSSGRGVWMRGVTCTVI